MENGNIELEHSNININELPVVEETPSLSEVKELEENKEQTEADAKETEETPVVAAPEVTPIIEPIVETKVNVKEPEGGKEPSYKELKTMILEKGLTFVKNPSREDLIKILEASNAVNTNVISLDNQPLSPIVISNDEEVIHEAFIATAPKRSAKAIIKGAYNGRIYKEIGNGYAIWCDTGLSFNLSSIK